MYDKKWRDGIEKIEIYFTWKNNIVQKTFFYIGKRVFICILISKKNEKNVTI